MHIYYYDENFMYMGEDIISEYDEMPKNATNVGLTKGLYLPKYNEEKREWSESATQSILRACSRNRLYLMI